MSHKDKVKLLIGTVYFIADIPLIYYVVRCLITGKVRWLSKNSAGGVDSRADKPGWYLSYILFYASIAIAVLLLTTIGIYKIIMKNFF